MAKIYYFDEWVKKMTVTAQNQITVKSIAKAFLCLNSMSPKKLQKLCYYAYAWHLTLYGEPLFENNFQAWIHGPVDPDLYDEYKVYGWRDIDAESVLPEEIQENPHVFEFLEEVFASYGHLSGNELEYLTHQQDPWLEARGDLKPYESSRTPIKDEVIIRYHSQELQNGQS